MAFKSARPRLSSIIHRWGKDKQSSKNFSWHPIFPLTHDNPSFYTVCEGFLDRVLIYVILELSICEYLSISVCLRMRASLLTTFKVRRIFWGIWCYSNNWLEHTQVKLAQISDMLFSINGKIYSAAWWTLNDVISLGDYMYDTLWAFFSKKPWKLS